MKAAALLLAVMALVTACTTKGAVDDAIARSTAPLLVPQGEWTDQFEFTAPPGSTDLYQVRWNFSPGATDAVTGWQITATSAYEAAAIAEGPGQPLVDEALRAARGDSCTIADPATGLQHCAYEAEFARDGVNAYLVRLLDNQVLVVDYVNPDGSRHDYNADTLSAHYINTDFASVPIEGDIDAYLVYIY